MEPYQKIKTVFNRDPATKYRTLLMGQYALPEFEYLKDNVWLFTEKVDGTNIRVMSLPDGSVVFGGKSDSAQIPAKLVRRLSELFPQSNAKLAEQFPDGACLYGEGCGVGIQKGGGNYSSSQDFVLFDVKIGGWWLERPNVEEIAGDLGIDAVPIIHEGTLTDLVTIVSAGPCSTWGDFQMEGVVARPKVSLLRRSGERIITKLKTKDFP